MSCQLMDVRLGGCLFLVPTKRPNGNYVVTVFSFRIGRSRKNVFPTIQKMNHGFANFFSRCEIGNHGRWLPHFPTRGINQSLQSRPRNAHWSHRLDRDDSRIFSTLRIPGQDHPHERVTKDPLKFVITK